MNTAFDRYVNEDADLLTELIDSEANAKAYQECTAAIAPFDATSGMNQQDYFGQFINCASSVDPEMFPQAG